MPAYLFVEYVVIYCLGDGRYESQRTTRNHFTSQASTFFRFTLHGQPEAAEQFPGFPLKYNESGRELFQTPDRWTLCSNLLVIIGQSLVLLAIL